MKLRILLGLIGFLPTLGFSQDVVVSGYFNAVDPRDEWIELLVVSDNVDMRGWTLRDNNSSQTSFQTAITFNNIAFWNNMRAGTIILIWNRIVASDGSTSHPTDVNKEDGYIKLNAQNTTYFTGGSFGTSPTWAGASLNYAAGGDVLQLRNSSATHVHALGHCATAGSNWTSLPSPKLNHQASLATGDAMYICPGSSLSDYGTNNPQNGTTYTAVSNTTTTFGLPNSCSGSAVSNTAFWNSVREPAFTSQLVYPVSVSGNPGSNSFTWSACTDPNPADVTTGYLILRNTSNTFTSPADGTTYAVGSSIGTATVIAEYNSSQSTSHTDNDVFDGNCYYYRVYAFRYTTDNLNGNAYHESRGRAYNQTSFVTVDCASPLPVELVSFDATPIGNDQIETAWVTASELNCDRYEVQISGNGYDFVSVAEVRGNGSSNQMHNYHTLIDKPEHNLVYVRLKQFDYNGQYQLSDIRAVQFHSQNIAIQNIYMSPGGVMQASVILKDNQPVWYMVTDISGKLHLKELLTDQTSLIQIPLQNFANGMYFFTLSNGIQTITRKFVK